jgi:hypothetical protein
MLPKKKKREKKVLLPTGVSKSAAHTLLDMPIALDERGRELIYLHHPYWDKGVAITINKYP